MKYFYLINKINKCKLKLPKNKKVSKHKKVIKRNNLFDEIYQI